MHEPSVISNAWNRSTSGASANVKGDLRTLQMLQPALRRRLDVTCAVYSGAAQEKYLHVWPGFYEGGIYGLAVDLGSTTIAGHLYNAVTGEIRASAGLMNPHGFGEDVGQLRDDEPRRRRRDDRRRARRHGRTRRRHRDQRRPRASRRSPRSSATQ